MWKYKNKSVNYTADIKQQLIAYGNVQNLMKYFNVENLIYEHKKMPSNKATGIDEIDKAQFEENLEENITLLIQDLKEKTYKPRPARRAFIPKINGDLRPLGILSYRDKLIQAVMSNCLSAIYEPIFLNCSFGFRPKLTCHSALIAVKEIIMHN